MNTPEEYAMEDFYDQISRELYPEHKEHAIEEFTEEKLKSYYKKNPNVMRPAVDAIQEGNWQLNQERYSASLIFYVTAIELLLKATLLRPVLHGLIHNEGLAEIMTNHILGQTGIVRYESLLSQLFENITGIKLDEIINEDTQQKIFSECKQIQKIRNNVIHQGKACTKNEASKAKMVSITVFEKIVQPMLHSIGLNVIEKGEIIDRVQINQL